MLANTDKPAHAPSCITQEDIGQALAATDQMGEYVPVNAICAEARELIASWTNNQAEHRNRYFLKPLQSDLYLVDEQNGLAAPERYCPRKSKDRKDLNR
jgi:hypothetical protein